MGDITRLIPDDDADVCILEEPEHLNWFRASGVNWRKKFAHVVGIIHTNYVYYTMMDTTHWASGRVKAPITRTFNKVMVRAYCDKVNVCFLCACVFFLTCIDRAKRLTNEEGRSVEGCSNQDSYWGPRKRLCRREHALGSWVSKENATCGPSRLPTVRRFFRIGLAGFITFLSVPPSLAVMQVIRVEAL